MDYYSERVASIEEEVQSWRLMASALRKDNRKLFEKMLSDVDREMIAILDSGKEPFDSVLMTIVLDQQKMISELMLQIDARRDRGAH